MNSWFELMHLLNGAVVYAVHHGLRRSFVVRYVINSNSVVIVYDYVVIHGP